MPLCTGILLKARTSSLFLHPLLPRFKLQHQWFFVGFVFFSFLQTS